MKKYFLLLLFPLSLFAQNTPLVRVDNYTALRALAIPTVNNRMAAIVSGYAGPVAEGGSIFIYDSASAVADDDDIYVKPDSTTGRWIKILKTGAGGGGNVSTDTIWDAKGDLAVGTGPNSAQKLTVGANDTILVADSAQTTGTKWLAITGFEAALEAVLDLQDLQGAVNDAQVPNNITVDLATLASTVTVVDSSDSTSYPLIVDSPTGNLPPKTDAALTYDASTGILGATGFSSSGASAGSIDLGDSDGSHFFSIRPNGTTTTSVNLQGPAAPFSGYVQFTVSGTNWVPSQVAFGVGLLGSDGSNVPVDVDTISEFSTALGITGTPSGTTFLRGDGTWSTPAGSGDVSKVGTPVDNQIGVWTGDGTIEGDTAFTWDTSTDTLTFAASANILFGAVTILDDNAGTMTLSNIDAIDATTETTLEAAIDIAGDVTGTGLGAVTIAANAVALGTDTTGNYVATIADGGASEVTVTGSGSETAAVTLALASGITRDTEWDTSAELRTAVTDESGSGALLFAGGDIAAGTATTAASEDNDTSIATTAFVQDARNKSVYISGSAVAKPNLQGSFHARLVASAVTNITITLPAVVANSDAATVTTDASLGTHFRWTATQNFTLANPTNPTDGQRVLWEIIQDGTGSRTIAFDTKFAFGTDITGVTLTTTINKRDFITAVYNSTADKWYVVGVSKGY